MPTPHISAQAGDFAESVLLPGDPLRARHIAEHYLEDARQVTGVRNMLGFTGSYRGRPVSVMGTGMGIPSSCIYATELVTEYGVKNLIRVGTCGAISPSLCLRDVVIAMGASTDSNVNRLRFDGRDFAAIASYDLLRRAVDCAATRGVNARVGNVFTSDLFYPVPSQDMALLERFGMLAIEMEAAGLYGVAAQYGANALCILAVTDLLSSGERASAKERERGLDEMLGIALDTAVGV